MEVPLDVVLDAIARRRWILPAATNWHLSLISLKPFDRAQLRQAIPRFVAAVHEQLGVKLILVGGGPGCSELEFAIDYATPEELAHAMQILLESPHFQKLAQEATLVRMQLRGIPNVVKKDLESGRIDNQAGQVFNARTVIVGQGGKVGNDQYVNTGQAMIMGPNGRVLNSTQVWNAVQSKVGEIDYEVLSLELARLRAALKADATEADHDEELGAVASAEKAAKKKDGGSVVAALSKSGKWALGVAERIGVGLVVAVLKEALNPAG